MDTGSFSADPVRELRNRHPGPHPALRREVVRRRDDSRLPGGPRFPDARARGGDRGARDPLRVEHRKAGDARSPARVVEYRAARPNPETVSRTAGKGPAVGAGDDDVVDVLGPDQRRGIAPDDRGPPVPRRAEDETRLLAARRLERNLRHGACRHPPHRLGAGLPRLAAEEARRLVRSG